ncbi:MAG TPA: TlpA disulfide reductase family protein [Solirubrobacteraceae bacterium]|nr:TlpA disulfide reductase family protein [Solirubrobacteraceae bacterium]
MPRRAVLFVLAAVIAGVLLAVGLSSAGTKQGRRAPGLPRERIAGAPTTLAALTRGRSAIVLFWASWCEPCQREAAAVERFARGPGAGRIVTVDWSDSLPGARAFVRRYGWTMPVLRDPEGAVGYAYGLTGLPTTFVVDSSGHIADELRGPQTETSLMQALQSG